MFYKFLAVFLSVFITTQAEGNVLAKDLRLTLRSGDRLPMIGFGTGGIRGTETVKQVLDDALAAGYRLFDSAEAYANEEQIGKALKELLPKHNLTRQQIFITTKLDGRPDRYGEHAYESLQKSVQRLDTDYVDLYLIHYPGYFKEPSKNRNFSSLRDETWKLLAKGQKDGLTKNIGVANYNIRHLKEILNNDYGVKPALNQVEWHPEYHQDDLLNFCRTEGIVLQAYFSLGGSRNKTRLLDNTDVLKISAKLGKNPAQVLLRWAVQQNVTVIPRTKTRKHMEENIDLNFVIPESDIEILNTMKQAHKYVLDPDSII